MKSLLLLWVGCSAVGTLGTIPVSDTPTGLTTDGDTDQVTDPPIDPPVPTDPPDPTDSTTGDTDPPEPTDPTEPTDPPTVPTETGEPEDTACPPPPVVVPDVDRVVDCNGGGDFLTIGEAIAASTSGDVIGLAPCTYNERVDYIGKSLDIVGMTGLAADVVIDGGGAGSVVTAAGGESYGTRIAWVTLTGGDDDAGAAVWVTEATLDMQGVVVTGNGPSATMVGVIAGRLRLLDSVVDGNAVTAGGQALEATAGSFHVRNSLVDCDGGGQGIEQHNVTLLVDSTVTCAGTAAVLIDGGEIHAVRSELHGGDVGLNALDNADEYNERSYLRNSVFSGTEQGALLQFMHAEILNSTFIGERNGLEYDGLRSDSWIANSAFLGGPCDLLGDGDEYLLEFNGFDNENDCDVVGATYTVLGEPLFIASPLDVQLEKGSPYIDAGDSDRDHDDRDGSQNDIGRWGGPLAREP